MNKDNFDKAKWVPIIITAVILMLIWYALGNVGLITSIILQFFSVIAPLLYGILFAYFIYPPHHAVEKLLKKVKIRFISSRARGFSTIIIFILLLILIVVIVSFVIPILFTSTVNLANSIPIYVTELLNYLDNLPSESFWADFDIAGTINAFSSQLMVTILNAEGLGQAAGAVIGFAGGLFSIVLGLIISLYILMDRDRISEFFLRLNSAIFKSESRRVRSARYFGQVNKVLFTFIASKGLDSLINFVVATTVLLIFDVPYSLLLGLIAGAFNFIPFIGSFFSAVLISLIALVTRDVGVALPVAIALIVFNQLDANYIEPRIMKSSLKISPILVIVAVVAGGAYFGIVGMFLAVPLTVVIKQLVLEYIDSTEQGLGDIEGDEPIE
ncbi:MAG: AI-2E family transporter [Oscillospiraceae bacterium]|nr:AI-2E family transporter [Oscillospiraceae bacterium]MCL2278499.1 AI-2E family transporter [Oscillospiraceae bacterium]